MLHERDVASCCMSASHPCLLPLLSLAYYDCRLYSQSLYNQAYHPRSPLPPRTPHTTPYATYATYATYIFVITTRTHTHTHAHAYARTLMHTYTNPFSLSLAHMRAHTHVHTHIVYTIWLERKKGRAKRWKASHRRHGPHRIVTLPKSKRQEGWQQRHREKKSNEKEGEFVYGG